MVELPGDSSPPKGRISDGLEGSRSNINIPHSSASLAPVHNLHNHAFPVRRVRDCRSKRDMAFPCETDARLAIRHGIAANNDITIIGRKNGYETVALCVQILTAFDEGAADTGA